MDVPLRKGKFTSYLFPKYSFLPAKIMPNRAIITSIFDPVLLKKLLLLRAEAAANELPDTSLAAGTFAGALSTDGLEFSATTVLPAVLGSEGSAAGIL